MKKGYVISLVIIGLLIGISVFVLMQDLSHRNLSDNLNPTKTEEKKEEKKEETSTPSEVVPDETKHDANSATTNITIRNEQSDSNIANYSYQIKITNVSGAVLTVKNDNREYLIFDANGNTSFNLLSNESITFVDVPVSSVYTIKQENKENYKTTVGSNETNTTSGTITGDNTVSFKNEVVSIPTPTPAPAEATPKKEPEKPAKQVESDVKNPITADKGMIAITISLVALFTLVLLKGLKLDRYEEL